MTEAKVIEIIEYLKTYKTETNKIEAKTASVDFPKKCYDTFSSFSNKYGGVIIFGINEERCNILHNIINHNRRHYFINIKLVFQETNETAYERTNHKAQYNNQRFCNWRCQSTIPYRNRSNKACCQHLS